MVIVVENGIDHPSSNLGRVCFYFALISLGKELIDLFSPHFVMHSLALIRQPNNEKENSDFKQTVLLLKTELVSHPTRGGRF